MWLRTLLLMVLIFLISRAVMRLLRGVSAGLGSAAGAADGRARAGTRTSAVKMVADPVCGTYVIPGRAVHVARGGQTFYFCSEKCRDSFSDGH